MSRYTLIGVEEKVDIKPVINSIPKSNDFWVVPNTHIVKGIIKGYEHLQTFDYSSTYIDVVASDAQTSECKEVNKEHIINNYNILLSVLNKILTLTDKVFLLHYCNGAETTYPLNIRNVRNVVFDKVSIELLASLDYGELLQIVRDKKN